VEGTVLFCCNTDVVVGSLADAPFSQHWHGPRWAEWRARMRDGRFLASCDFCGKLNQNEKLSARFKDMFGDALWDRHRGVGLSPDDAAPFRRARPAGAPRGRALPVLP
jgi:hypothetical protein